MDKNGVIFVLILISFSQGIERCPKHGMTYHPKTQSCFFVFDNQAFSFFDCRNKVCGRHKGGVDRNEPGTLAKVLDKATDDFLRENLVSSSQSTFWIGLNDLVSAGQYQWDKFYIYQPNYFRWAPGQPNPNKIYRNVVFESEGWKKADKSEIYPCLCEVNGVIRPVSGTANTPVEIGVKAEDVATCSFSLSWTKLSWSSPGGQDVVLCHQTSDGQTSCTSSSTGYDATITGDTESKLQISKFDRTDEGRWKCVVMSGQEKAGEKSFQIYGYEAAKELTCQHEVNKIGVEVICSMDKIYPEAVCSWQYKNENQDSYKILPDSQSTQIFQQRSFVSETGENNVDSKCVLRLEQDEFDFKPGSLYLKITVYPNVEGKGRIKSSSSVSHENVVVIESLMLPAFKMLNGTKLEGSVSFVSGDPIHLICYLYHGKPSEYRTTLKCGNPSYSNADSGHVTYTETWLGKSVVMKTTATDDMDRQRCTCIGTHLKSGKTTTSSHLLLNVQYPAKVNTFTVDNARSVSSKYEIEKGRSVQLICTYRGNPSVTIRHIGSSNITMPVKKSRSGTAETSFKADCSSNGEYVCESSNSVTGELTEFNRSLEISVKCPPTPCTDDDKNKTVDVVVGAETRVMICLYANPKPDYNLFELYSFTSKNDLAYKDDYTVSFTDNGNARFTIILSMKENLLGKIDLYYNKEYILQFHLIPREYYETGGALLCPSEATVIGRGLHFVTLQWKAGSNHDHFEIYEVFLHNGSISTWIVEIMANETSGTKTNIAYNLSGLVPGSTYNISIGTKNNLVERQCNDLWFDATTTLGEEAVRTGWPSKATWAVVGAIVFLSVCALSIALVFLWRKKQKQKDKNEKFDVMMKRSEHSSKSLAPKDKESEASADFIKSSSSEYVKMSAFTCDVYSDMQTLTKDPSIVIRTQENGSKSPAKKEKGLKTCVDAAKISSDDYVNMDIMGEHCYSNEIAIASEKKENIYHDIPEKGQTPLQKEEDLDSVYSNVRKEQWDSTEGTMGFH